MYKRIYDHRTKLRLSQVDLANRSGVSQSQLSKYEKGEIIRPSHKKLNSIALALGVAVTDLMDDNSDHPNPTLRPDINQDAVEWIALFTEKHEPNDNFKFHDGIRVRQRGNQHQIKRPSFLEHSVKAHALVMSSETMTPRYKKGDTLFIDPTLTAQKGDDVALYFKVEDFLVAIIREYKSINSKEVETLELMSGQRSSISIERLDQINVIVGTHKARN